MMHAVLCREEAKKVWALKPELDALGVGLVALIHERIPEEVRLDRCLTCLPKRCGPEGVTTWCAQVSEFHPAYWPGPLYHDTDKVFYKALGGGTLLRHPSMQAL